MGGVGAVIVPCSARKRFAASHEARAVSLPIGFQDDVETEWLARLEALPRTVEAGALYAGRGASIGRQAASAVAAPLHVISAGLGLVKANRLVPPYGLTVGHRGDDSVSARIKGRFDPAEWWSAVSKGPVACDLRVVMTTAGEARVLVALTRPYAAMVAPALVRLDDSSIARLRLFGWRLGEALPPRLTAAVMPYDARLEAAIPGTRCDFAHRALLHFATRLVEGGRGDQGEDAKRVRVALSTLAAPKRATRPRASDSEVAAWVEAALDEDTRIGRLLQRLREQGIACEQARFSRIYRSVVAKIGRIAA